MWGKLVSVLKKTAANTHPYLFLSRFPTQPGTKQLPTRILNGLNYMFSRARTSRAPFYPHPAMQPLNTSVFGRYIASDSWLVGLIKDDCTTQWVLTVQSLISHSQKCIPGRSGLCNICPLPKYAICDLSEPDIAKEWGPGAVCMYDKLNEDLYE